MQISMKDLEKLSLSEMEDLLAGSRKIHMDNRRLGDKVWLHHGGTETAELQQTGQARARGGEAVSDEGDGHQPSADDSLDRAVDRSTDDRTEARAQAEFARRYRNDDIHLLAATDAAHEDLSGPALRRILHREHRVFGKAEYETLSRDLGVTPLQPAPERGIPQAASARAALHKAGRFPSARDASPTPKASRVICASIPCIRAITTAKRACITSMPSTL